jgi:hypothetical protein
MAKLEVRSGGSVEQRCGSMYKNRIRGLRRRRGSVSAHRAAFGKSSYSDFANLVSLYKDILVPSRLF